tara:strand:- start:35 stop:463 length:429 start_codon:yes stop_codon:yes gene_type:complete
MGNSKSIIKVNFEDIQSIIQNNKGLIINVMEKHEQKCLIKNTIDINEEEHIINNYINNGNTNVNIILYGKNSNDFKIHEKYNQLLQLGFTNVTIYIGGLFEWMLLQDIYGSENFPTTTNELDILKFKPQKVLFVQRLPNVTN